VGGSVAGGLALIGGLVYYFKFRKPKKDDERLTPTSGDGSFDLDVQLESTQVGTLTF
jgi:hypothetical protein